MSSPTLLMAQDSLGHILPEGFDDAFGHWLAGLVDGEGCFLISEKPDGWRYCQFALNLRADDRAILEEVARRTQCGRISHRRHNDGRNPQMAWRITSKRDCLRLVAIFDRCPLRAKKARDFKVWRTAVIEWTRGDQTRLGGLKRALTMVRSYRPDPVGAVDMSPRRPDEVMELGDV